jgi:predicted O-methyltransferase YrrM
LPNLKKPEAWTDIFGMVVTAQTDSVAQHPRPLIDALRVKRREIYDSGMVTGENGAMLPVWPVGLTEARGEALRAIVSRERAKSCVETGFAYGMSASFILEAMLGHDTSARLVSIDPFQNMSWRGAGRRHLREAGVSEFHEFVQERSEYVLPRMIQEGRRFDAAFIDGDHRFEHAMLDIFYARRLVGAGRLIVVDDAWMPAVRKAGAFFASSSLCSIETSPDIAESGKFLLLRVRTDGDERAWDHFAEF